MISIFLLIYNSSSLLLSMFLLTVPRAPTTSGINVTFMWHNLFSSQAKSRYLSCFLSLFTFTGLLKSIRGQVLFLLIKIRSDILAWIGRSVWISKSQRTLCISFLRTAFSLCLYYLLVRWNFVLLHNSWTRECKNWILWITKMRISVNKPVFKRLQLLGMIPADRR